MTENKESGMLTAAEFLEQVAVDFRDYMTVPSRLKQEDAAELVSGINTILDSELVGVLWENPDAFPRLAATHYQDNTLIPYGLHFCEADRLAGELEDVLRNILKQNEVDPKSLNGIGNLQSEPTKFEVGEYEGFVIHGDKIILTNVPGFCGPNSSLHEISRDSLTGAAFEYMALRQGELMSPHKIASGIQDPEKSPNQKPYQPKQIVGAMGKINQLLQPSGELALEIDRSPSGHGSVYGLV
ncbi:hypothetical protein ACFL1B_04990, partial [Nanoarchaeota archaeon]